MKIWWCTEHESKAATPMLTVIGRQIGMCQQYSLTPSEGQNRCQFVEMDIQPVEPDPPEMTEPLFTNTHGTW